MVLAGFILSTFLGPSYGKNTHSWIEFWNSIFQKKILGTNKSRSRNGKIDQIIGKSERIPIKKDSIFVWDNAWAMDDIRVRNLTFQYRQSA